MQFVNKQLTMCREGKNSKAPFWQAGRVSGVLMWFEVEISM